VNSRSNFSNDDLRNGSDTSGSDSRPTDCDIRAARSGVAIFVTLLMFPAFLLLVAEPPIAAEPLLVSSPSTRERFALLWVVADPDMIVDSGCWLVGICLVVEIYLVKDFIAVVSLSLLYNQTQVRSFDSS
jgi:hypothetical protein